MNNLLEGIDISVTFKAYGDEIKAVRNVNFVLPEGKVVGIVGESGSGKSTLARVLSGLQIPTSGLVKYLGEDIRQGSGVYKGELRKAVQMVFQDPYSSLNPRMRIINAVTEGVLQHQTKDKQLAREIASKLLKEWELAKSILENIRSLSLEDKDREHP